MLSGILSGCSQKAAGAPHMRRTRCVRIAALAITAMAISSACCAQSHPEYIRLGRLSAALYHPDSGPAPHVAFILAHRTANYLNHIGCRELSARGFLALCFNTRLQNNESQVRWEETPRDVHAAVEVARRRLRRPPARKSGPVAPLAQSVRRDRERQAARAARIGFVRSQERLQPE